MNLLQSAVPVLAAGRGGAGRARLRDGLFQGPAVFVTSSGALAGVGAPFSLVRKMRRNSGIPSRTVGGFTVVELVAVIVLVAILAITAIPRFQDRNAIDVSAKAQQLASDIRYTQSLAMATGQRNRINLAATSYQITTSSGVPVVHPATGSTAPISLGGVSLSGYNPPLTNNYLAFDAKGVPYTDVAGTTLNTNAVITLTESGSTRTVTVSPQTGRVAVQ
jgi:MSHA pilin protein MshC